MHKYYVLSKPDIGKYNSERYTSKLSAIGAARLLRSCIEVVIEETDETGEVLYVYEIDADGNVRRDLP